MFNVVYRQMDTSYGLITGIYIWRNGQTANRKTTTHVFIWTWMEIGKRLTVTKRTTACVRNQQVCCNHLIITFIS